VEGEFPLRPRGHARAGFSHLPVDVLENLSGEGILEQVLQDLLAPEIKPGVRTGGLGRLAVGLPAPVLAEGLGLSLGPGIEALALGGRVGFRRRFLLAWVRVFDKQVGFVEFLKPALRPGSSGLRSGCRAKANLR
jgi:hypothetical protein